MLFKLRFVQYFDKKNEREFWECEKAFVELEKKEPNLKRGKRYAPVIGREPVNCMIWEAEYDTEEEAVAVLKTLAQSSEHDELLDRQIGYMRDNYVELYKQIM